MGDNPGRYPSVQHRTSGKLRYRFDNFMGKGSLPLLGALLAVFLIAFVVLAILRIVAVEVFGLGPIERGDGALRQLYITFLELTDPGSMTQDVDSGMAVKVFAILSGLTGVVLFSALIAFITTALDERLRELRRGRSRVVASDHTVLLGWNDRIADIVRELVLANESEKSATVLVVADQEKEDMDEFLGTEVPDHLSTSVVTRRGNPAFVSDLGLASLDSCKSVIVLAECTVTASETLQHDSDISVIKKVLAVFASAGAEFPAPIVCEVFRDAERAVLEDLAPGQIIALDSSEILAKILVQTSRSVGLSAVYEEVLSFDGAELYLFEDQEWGDVTFADASLRMPDGVPFGFVRNEAVNLNPPRDAPLQSGDALLVLASDDSALKYLPAPVASPVPEQLRSGRLQPVPERILIIGWTSKAPTVVREYDDYLVEGSEICVVSRSSSNLSDHVAALDGQLENIALSVAECDPLNIDDLAQLDPHDFDQILILSQGRNGPGSEKTTDSETIVILLLLRSLLAKSGQSRETKLITEILESSNSALVRHVGGHDFIISNQLVSTLAAQLSEGPELLDVYNDLFSEEGSELYLKPIGLYCEPGTRTFASYMALAQARGEVAIGYRHAAVKENQGVCLIPPKDETISLQEGDCLVVLAEDER